MQKAKAILLLGGNQGPVAENIRKAEELLAITVGNILQKSSLYESEPWGFEAKQNFLNEILVIETQLSPDALLQNILSIEERLGRKRHQDRWDQGFESRPIDIDILYYDSLVLQTNNLEIPHPGIPKRRFTLEPLNELLPGFVHPVLKKTQAELLKNCNDNGKVEKIARI